MKVGDEVWLFSENWREYVAGQSGPVYSSHFRKFKIEGETSRSWIVCDKKFPKADARGLYTDQQKDDEIWANETRYKIVRQVEHCSVEKLKLIQQLLLDK
jgi:hypothetical protein